MQYCIGLCIVDQYHRKIHVCPPRPHNTPSPTLKAFLQEPALDDQTYAVYVPHKHRQTINYKTGAGGRSELKKKRRM